MEDRMGLLTLAMEALRAPPLALAWIDEIRSNFSATSPTIMFGASPTLAKLYFQIDRGAEGFPNLPVSSTERLFERLPLARTPHLADIVSLEWSPHETEATTRVVLRHYAAESLSYEQMVSRWASERVGLAQHVLHAVPASNVTGMHLVWRSVPYTPEIERVPPLRPTKLGIFLRSNGSGVDAVSALVAEPSDVLVWSSRAKSQLASSSLDGLLIIDRVRRVALRRAHSPLLMPLFVFSCR